MDKFPIKPLDLDLDLDMNNNSNETKEIEFGQTELIEFYKKNEENIQSLIKCPIACFIPVEPVVADDGNIYEEDAISTCYSSNYGKSPITNQKITNNFQSVPLWNEIINIFIKIDPELKNIMNEKDFTYANNKITITSILGSKQKHTNLLKYKNFKLLDHNGYSTFVSSLLSCCHDINVIKHVIENADDFKMTDYNYDIFYVVCMYSTPDIVKYFISNGYSLTHNYNNELLSLKLMNNKYSSTDEELMTIISNSLKNTLTLDDGTPIITKCVVESTFQLIKLLIDSGHDVLAKDLDGNNLLKLAANNNRDDQIILYLIEEIYKKDPNVIEESIISDGRTIIHWLFCGGYGRKPNVDLIKKLVQIGINLEVVNPINNWKPIHYICRYTNTQLILYVMGIGLDLTTTCMYEGNELPPLALLDINNNIKDSDKEQLLNEFFQFIELQNLTKNQ